VARVQGHECACAASKYFEASITMAVGGLDIDIGLWVDLRRFI
jgi:hypothetical protein